MPDGLPDHADLTLPEDPYLAERLRLKLLEYHSRPHEPGSGANYKWFLLERLLSRGYLNLQSAAVELMQPPNGTLNWELFESCVVVIANYVRNGGQGNQDGSLPELPAGWTPPKTTA